MKHWPIKKSFHKAWSEKVKVQEVQALANIQSHSQLHVTVSLTSRWLMIICVSFGAGRRFINSSSRISERHEATNGIKFLFKISPILSHVPVGCHQESFSDKELKKFRLQMLQICQFSPWFFILHHFLESQWLQDATNDQHTPSYPGYKQCRTKGVSGEDRLDKVWDQHVRNKLIITKQAKNNNVLRGNSSHSSSDPHLHHSTFIIAVGGRRETGHDLIGIDWSSCNATHSWRRVLQRHRQKVTHFIFIIRCLKDKVGDFLALCQCQQIK